MTYNLPAHGELNYDAKLSPSLQYVKDTAEAAETPTGAQAKATAAQNAAISAAATDATNKANAAQNNAITSAASDATTKANAVQSSLNTHVGNVANPHSVTKAQVGLGNVDNTADASKPVSTAQQAALDAKQAVASLDADVAARVNDTASSTRAALDGKYGHATVVTGSGIDPTGAADSTTGVQALINGLGSGGVLEFPPGTYKIGTLDATGKSNVTFRGIRGRSVIQGGTGTSPVLGWNTAATPAANDKGITIEGLTFKGVTGLSQNTYLLSISAVDDVRIQNCEFIQFRGDAIYLGRTHVGGSDTGVQNHRVKIVGNLFDGVDYTNRNAISIIAGDDVLIDGNTFRRCTDSTMPGAIDIEPNSWDTSAILRDIRVVNNTFDAVGGNVAAVALVIHPTAPTTQPARIHIAHNTFRGSVASDVYLSWVGHDATDTDALTVCEVLNNSFGTPGTTSQRSVTVDGLRGVRVEGNTFIGRTQGAFLGGATKAIRETTFKNNLVLDCGGTSQQITTWANAAKVSVERNIALFTTPTASHFVYLLSGGTSNAVNVSDNTLRGINYAATKDAGHTTTASTNYCRGNIGAGPAALADFAGAPSVTGSRGGNVALANLLTQLASKGIIVDGSSA